MLRTKRITCSERFKFFCMVAISSAPIVCGEVTLLTFELLVPGETRNLFPPVWRRSASPLGLLFCLITVEAMDSLVASFEPRTTNSRFLFLFALLQVWLIPFPMTWKHSLHRLNCWKDFFIITCGSFVPHLRFGPVALATEQMEQASLQSLDVTKCSSLKSSQFDLIDWFIGFELLAR